MTEGYFIVRLRTRYGLYKGGVISYDVIDGPFKDERDAISAIYDYEDKLRNVLGPNGKRTFNDEAISHLVEGVVVQYI